MMAYVALLSSLVRSNPFAMESTDYHYRTACKREEAISEDIASPQNSSA